MYLQYLYSQKEYNSKFILNQTILSFSKSFFSSYEKASSTEKTQTSEISCLSFRNIYILKIIQKSFISIIFSTFIKLLSSFFINTCHIIIFNETLIKLIKTDLRSVLVESFIECVWIQSRCGQCSVRLEIVCLVAFWVWYMARIDQSYRVGLACLKRP
jgi:hypothetical protein